MPALFVFLLKVNIALLLFCAGYYLVLRHLTFYTLNRIYLVTAILFASVYPQINLSGFMERHQQLTRPVQAVVFNWQTPAEVFIKPLTQPDYWYWVEIVFWTGASLLTLRLIAQLYSLYKLYRNSTPAKIHNHSVRVMNEGAAPFSFWKSIYVNPASHAPADLKAILLHEQVHVNEWHTLDILLAELSTIFYWFNPGIWLIKKAIRENIEFITDRKILKKGIDTKQYQYSLVNVSFAARPQGIVNHFNVSTIKKRIIMMNAKRSSKFTLTRYAFLVPVVVAMLLVFSISKAALVKKSINAYKTIALAIPPIKPVTKVKANSIVSNTTPHVAQNMPKPDKSVFISSLKPNTKAADTLKNGNVLISTDEKSDSLNYIINGVKVKKADFKALDSDKIYSIEILTGEQASKIMDHIDTKHSALFVTTDDSEAGKKFKDKIDGLNTNQYTIAAKNYAYGSSNPVAPEANYVISKKPVAWGTINKRGKSHIYMNLKKTPHAAIAGGNWSVTDNNAPMVLEYHRGPDSLMTYSYNIKKGVSVDWTEQNAATAVASSTAPTTIVYGSGAYNYSPKAVIFGRGGYNSTTNIEHLSAKMIIIDGKEATENDLKKLSAADIDGMLVKSGEEITKKYGDKGKNGVVFITTKKAK